jgi:hypothetical protein
MPKNRSVKKNVQRRGSKHATRKASSLKSGILRRDTRQDDQERKSRAQFCEVFSDWIPADISPDKGEDLLVRIYEDRRWTALTFFAQLKSTQHLDRETQTEDAISLSLDTKDFPHWIDANPPVIVVFWDVNKRTGVWQDFPRIMSEVSASTPGWRKQKTVTAHIPKKNTTDEKGRRLLRQRIATLTYPVISKGRTMEVKFSTQFPPTDDGRAQHLGLVRALEDGLPLVIPPENVTALSFPDWHERAFGKVTGKVQLEISPAKREKEPELAFTFVGRTADRVVEAPLVLRRTGGGTVRSFWDNSHRDDALVVKLTVENRTGGRKSPRAKDLRLSAEVGAAFPRKSVESNLALVRLMTCIAQGGKVELTADGLADPLAKVEIRSTFPLELLHGWEGFLKKLSVVQQVVRRYGTFDLSGGFTRDDMITTERMHQLLILNSWERTFSMTTTLVAPIQVPPDASTDGPLTLKGDLMGQFDLLGVKVPLGRFEAELLDVEAGREALKRSLGTTEFAIPDAHWRFRLLYDPSTPPPDLKVQEGLPLLSYSSADDGAEDDAEEGGA